MTLIDYKIIAALLIFLASIVTVIYPLRDKDKVKRDDSLELGEALASGIFLGVAFFHMLPSAVTIFSHLYPQTTYPIAEAVCVSGFLLLLLLERLSLSTTLLSPATTIPYILALILIIHSLTEGAALGIGNLAEATVLFIAIIAHKGSASFALCMTLLRYHLSMKRIIILLGLFSLMTPIGIALGTWMTFYTASSGGKLAAGIFNAFAAGTFIYISALHHIRFHQRIGETQGLIEYAFLTLGIIAMAIIAIWA